MTYEQAAELFTRYDRASIWRHVQNPRVFVFHRDGGAERTLGVYEDDGLARYLTVSFSAIREYVEPTGEPDGPKDVYYRLRRRAGTSIENT
jgi:hypothetical protein